MSFVPVFQYMLGLAAFGIVYYIADGILSSFLSTSVQKTGYVLTLFQYLWIGIIIIYLIFGGWWLIRKYNEMDMQGGMY